MKTAKNSGSAETQISFIGSHERDVEYTPRSLSRAIIGELRPSGRCLDPCRGDGSFWDQLPVGSGWCEIEDGRDFFDENGRYDWIIGNPPYSIFRPFLSKSFKISDNVAFLLPFNKPFQSDAIQKLAFGYGGLATILAHGSGSSVGLPFGFAVGTFHWKRNHSGPTDIRWVRSLR